MHFTTFVLSSTLKNKTEKADKGTGSVFSQNAQGTRELLQILPATFVKGNWFLRGVPDNCGNLLDHEMITVTLS